MNRIATFYEAKPASELFPELGEPQRSKTMTHYAHVFPAPEPTP
jgi:hypothetical protein